MTNEINSVYENRKPDVKVIAMMKNDGWKIENNQYFNLIDNLFTLNS